MANSKNVIFIVNFNTTEMTNSALLSIRKHSSLPIFVFDNSDKNKFVLNSNIDEVFVLDNTEQLLIDFNKEFNRLDSRFHIPMNIKLMHEVGNKFGSFKHCLTIQWFLDHCNADGVILFDSDIDVKKDFEDIIDDKYITVGELHLDSLHYSRFYPFILYINNKMRKELCIVYYDEHRMQDISHFYVGYDTGGSFCEDILSKNLPYKTIKVTDYIVHYGAGSWKPSKFSGNLEYKT